MSFEKFRRLEEKGELDKAAEELTVIGLNWIFNSGLEASRELRVGTSMLLQSCSYYSISDKDDASYIMQIIVQKLLEYIRENQGNDEWLNGLISEWVGDSHFILAEHEEALRYYKEAEEVYERMPQTKQNSWGMEQEFDHAFFAFETYVEEEIGQEFTSLDGGQTSLNVNFIPRIQKKISLALQNM